MTRETAASNRTLSRQSLCYPADQAATPRAGCSQRSQPAWKAVVPSLLRARTAVPRASGTSARASLRGGSARVPPVGAQRRRLAPSVCVRVRLADSAVRDPAVRLLGGRVGRESAGPFPRGDGSGVEGKQRSGVAGSSALRLPRVCGTAAHSHLTAAMDFGGGGARRARPRSRAHLGASPGGPRSQPALPPGLPRYLVDPASSHMLVSKIKPCTCKFKLSQ
uniref:Uncharacterized protein n=1 Tax=Branchiostoma floridae TaxID=7739 RepID=C3ZXX1_BRAFL|eukprot:XP_002586579.1 hypothetical protein BRAFLDRAFT_106173 [Branchiostoma floridae]